MLREISSIIRDEVKDPRIGFVTVISVDLPENLRYARVYISPMGSEEEKVSSFKGVCSAAKFIRNCLGKRMRIKKMPEIVFKLDSSTEYADKINRMLHNLEAGASPKVLISGTDEEDSDKGVA